MVVYSAVPILCSMGYMKLAVALNNFEGHRTEKKKANALTLKVSWVPLL